MGTLGKWWRRGRPATAPGASGPGDPGYEGGATVGDEGAAAVDQSWRDIGSVPTGDQGDSGTG